MKTQAILFFGCKTAFENVARFGVESPLLLGTANLGAFVHKAFCATSTPNKRYAQASYEPWPLSLPLHNHLRLEITSKLLK
jgi:hypothetical protein